MKRIFSLLTVFLGACMLGGCHTVYHGPGVITWLLGIPGLLLVILSVLRIRSTCQYNRQHPQRPLPGSHHELTAMVLLAGLILIVTAFITTFLR